LLIEEQDNIKVLFRNDHFSLVPQIRTYLIRKNSAWKLFGLDWVALLCCRWDSRRRKLYLKATDWISYV